ncbi:Nramp family divalent metal transporter [Lutibaculum baratangense]|uniref:Mn2+/Fe2+ transporter, NRAMP family n=1 Tax=Lutibaculum baratangense AMV1 TaxID=631454 RepID=V4T7S3_9HYPH|nr:Nramp family divalent metal transporter [Lutibaculum baratangense]ESR22658.1 Mn2+/Fe2+ transporter, NRAMP family [Lutibaculum baratangense AMV1]
MSSTTIDTDAPARADAVAEDVAKPGDTIYLDAPGTTLKDSWKAAGPGIAAAMTGIGASHIMHAPTAGAQYGYALLWIIPAAYLLKYCAFEFAHRYTLVKGESVMEAYGRVGQWPFYYLIFQSFANTFGIAGRALGCGAMLWAAFPFMPLEAWSLAVLLASVAILWAGKYSALESAVKICIIVFALCSFIAFALQAPPPGEYLSRLLPTLPPIGAMLLFGAMWGYFPTTVEVAPMQSNWAVDKKSGMVKVHELRRQGYKVEMHPDYMKNYLTLFKRDMNTSYIVAMLTGMVFLIVGAVVLQPLGIVPESREMGLTIARIYTDTFGAWVFPIIIAGGVAALFSTVFTYFDGQARLAEESFVRIRRKWDNPETRKLIYRSFHILWIIGGAAIMFGMPRPIFVVQVASVLALLFSPVIYWLNIRAVNEFGPDEMKYKPGPFMMGLAWFGTVSLAIISIYVLVTMLTT